MWLKKPYCCCPVAQMATQQRCSQPIKKVALPSRHGKKHGIRVMVSLPYGRDVVLRLQVLRCVSDIVEVFSAVQERNVIRVTWQKRHRLVAKVPMDSSCGWYSTHILPYIPPGKLFGLIRDSSQFGCFSVMTHVGRGQLMFSSYIIDVNGPHRSTLDNTLSQVSRVVTGMQNTCTQKKMALHLK